MADSSIYRDVLREYERDMNSAVRTLQEKTERMYEKLPRVKEIDDTLTKLGLEVASLVLKRKSDWDKTVAEMQEMEEALLYERKTLLKKHKFTDKYFYDAYKCAACLDTGFIDNERCKCLQQRLINRHYEASAIGKVIKIENFDNFKTEYYSDEPNERYGVSPKAIIKKNAEKCKEFINSFNTGDIPMNLYLYGDTGLGKTYLCNCIAKELLDRGYSVLYLTAPQLFKTVEAIRFGRERGDAEYILNEKMEFVYSADLLIIDDLGSEFSTAVTASEFFNILNTRLQSRKQMIFSTNLMPKDLSDSYSDRVTSRIIGNFTMLLFIGDDIREYKKYNSIKD
jgi:DNA replication protein DnaC